MTRIALLALALAASTLASTVRAEDCTGTKPCTFDCFDTETWRHPVSGAITSTYSTKLPDVAPGQFAWAKGAFEKNAAGHDADFRAASHRYDSCKSLASPCSAEAFNAALAAFVAREASLHCAQAVADVLARTSSK